MFRALAQRLAALFSRGDADAESERQRFAGSALDWSINYSHGVDDSEAAREMARVQEQAEILDEQERYRN